MDKQSKQGFEFSLELRCIAYEVVRHLWVVLALAISVACVSFIGAKLVYTPTYTSSTTFAVSGSGGGNSAYANLQSAKEMVPTVETLIRSDLIQKRVSEDMGLDSVPGTIAVRAVPETNLVTISATASRPDVAFQLLKSLLKVYPEVGEKTLGKIIMEEFDQPKYPALPDRPFAGLRTMEIAFVCSFLLISGVLAVFFYLQDTVKTEEQARRKLDTQLFSVVYHEKQYHSLRDLLRRKKKSMLLTDPSVSFLYGETMKKISTKLLYKMQADQAKVVLITSTVANEGKSTIAMNLAQDISRRGKKVLLIEGNLQQPGLAKVLGVEHQKHISSWGSWLRQNQDPTEAICSLAHYGFRALLNSNATTQASDWLEVADLAQWLQAWKEQYDLILVDAPPVRRRSDTEIWAKYADLSLLVVRQNVAETKYINDSIDMLNEYGSGVLGCIYNDAVKKRDYSTTGSGYNYGKYNGYGEYGNYGKYGKYERRPERSASPRNEGVRGR